MPGGAGQFLFGGKRGMRRVLHTSFTADAPEFGHAAHGDVRSAVCENIHHFGELQQIDNPCVNCNRRAPRALVDGIEVVHAVVRMVDIIELVVLRQEFVRAGQNGFGVLFARIVNNHRCHGVERVKKSLFVPCRFRGSRAAPRY
ncbi:hypothetical protein SDC9_192899 [bioreactor metagenome]|uniref:Uncharacterized protein n=1 Tax=bioreactor metagenome TaxID=1076179 RepID=A0A645I3I2_9ZZZZ